MSRDTIVRDDAGNAWSLDNLSTQRWLEGHRPGAEAVAAWLMDRAVCKFREGKDEEAAILRGLVPLVAKEVVPHLVTRAQQHAEEYPAEHDPGPPSDVP